VVHQRTTQQGRTTFADHGVIGWSVGPAMNHYRHWTFYIPKTRGTRVSDTVVFLPEKYTMPATASSDWATAAIEELTEALKNPSAADPFLDTGNKLNEAIAALTEMSAMNQTTTSTKGSVTPSPRMSGQRTTTKEPIRKRNTSPQVAGSPQMPVNPRLAHHRGTRVLSSTVSLESFNSTKYIKNNTINNNNNDNKSTKNITGSPLTNPNINDKIIDTQRKENSPQRRQLRTRTTKKKQDHKLNTAVYRIFCDDGAHHQGYICGFDTKEGYYKTKYHDGDIEEATEEEVYRMLKKPNKTAMARALSATRFDPIHEQYCKTISRMPIASKFSNGFGKAVAILDYMGGKGDAFIPDKQEYKYRANAVIDKDTGKSMEYRDLLKDPKHREDWSRAAANEFGRLFNGVGKNKDGTQQVVGTNTCHTWLLCMMMRWT
jgi:hypothetical protein